MQALTMPDIAMESFIDAPPARVYEHLTTAGGWNAWFTKETTEINVQPSSTFVLKWRDCGPRHCNVDCVCTVVAAEQNKSFAFEWQPAGDLRTKVEFKLVPRGKGTIIEFRETGYSMTEDSMKHVAECAVFWGEAITLLKVYLEHGITYGAVP